jgi:hypothetical protein
VVEIGGYRTLIEEPKDRPCFFWPNPRFAPFLSADAHAPDITITIDLVRQLSTLKKPKTVFDSGAGLWQLYEDADGYLLESCLAESGVPLMQAHLSQDFSDVRVTLRTIRPKSSTRDGWSPMILMNPLLEIVLQEKLAREGGALLHSSGVLVGDDALVFCGPSGAGKSTIAEFFLGRGFTVLNDERVILRRQGGDVRAFGTPWPGSSGLYANAQGHLAQIFAIGHGQTEHVVAPIPTRLMMTRLLQECYLPHWDAEGVTRTVDLFARVAELYGSLQLSFRKSPDIVDFLTERFMASVG